MAQLAHEVAYHGQNKPIGPQLEAHVVSKRELSKLLSALRREHAPVQCLGAFRWAQGAGLDVDVIHFNIVLSAFGQRKY
jgi:hypothetical protein